MWFFWLNHPVWHRYTTFLVPPWRHRVSELFKRYIVGVCCFQSCYKVPVPEQKQKRSISIDKSTSTSDFSDDWYVLDISV
jgi:hypothetical protein